MLSSAAIRCYVAALGERGIPLEDVIARQPIAAAQLQPGGVVTPEQYRFLVHRLMQLTGEAPLGIMNTAFKDLADLGALGYASRTSRSVRDTHRLWSRFAPALAGMMGKLEIVQEDARSVTMGFASPDASDPLFRFSVEELLTMVGKVGRAAGADAPRSVLSLSLSYREPRCADQYEALLGCPLRFGAERSTIRVTREWFDRRLPTHDEEFDALCRSHCEQLYRRIENTMSTRDQLGQLFARAARLPATLEEAARLLRISSRTLRRRLHDEGTSFRAESEAFRHERAKEYLRRSELNTKEIAYRLGFSDPNALRNAFKNWTGMTISDFRRRGVS